MGEAYTQYINKGVVSSKCQPYVLPPKGCVAKCTASNLVYSKDLSFGKSQYALPAKNAARMQQDIYTYGPITAAFYVYDDFFNYKSGVYHHVSGGYAGGHAIKIIGWGVENKIPFWLCVNSWGTGWGMSGLFKIKRGVDECGIESWGVVAGYPK